MLRVRWQGWAAVAISSVTLAGCGCAYGGPGCGDPSIEGICEPRIEVGTEVEVTVVYATDTGTAPANVTEARSEDPTTASASLGTTEGSLLLVGNAVGTTPIELAVDGWDDLVWFTLSVEATAPDYVCNGREVPGFYITGRTTE